MSGYPIMVERLTKAQALRIVCERCGAEEDISGDDLLNEGLYTCPSGIATCGGTAVMKYDEGDKCQNCGKLDWSLPRGRYCSRRCELQGEYAASLKAAQA